MRNFSLFISNRCVHSSDSPQIQRNLQSAIYCKIQITAKPYTEESCECASLQNKISSKPRPLQQRKIAQSKCFNVPVVLKIRPVSFHIIYKNAN